MAKTTYDLGPIIPEIELINDADITSVVNNENPTGNKLLSLTGLSGFWNNIKDKLSSGSGDPMAKYKVTAGYRIPVEAFTFTSDDYIYDTSELTIELLSTTSALQFKPSEMSSDGTLLATFDIKDFPATGLYVLNARARTLLTSTDTNPAFKISINALPGNNPTPEANKIAVFNGTCKASSLSTTFGWISWSKKDIGYYRYQDLRIEIYGMLNSTVTNYVQIDGLSLIVAG